MPPRHWAHEETIVAQKGRVKSVCKCGAQSVKCATVEEAHMWYVAHVGLKEKRGAIGRAERFAESGDIDVLLEGL